MTFLKYHYYILSKETVFLSITKKFPNFRHYCVIFVGNTATPPLPRLKSLKLAGRLSSAVLKNKGNAFYGNLFRFNIFGQNAVFCGFQHFIE